MPHRRTQTRVLIVDDNEVIRSTLAGIIRHDERYVVVGLAANGETALAAIRTTRPHLICLDLRMGEIDGFEVLQQIRDKHEHIRVVMVTAQSTPEIVQKAIGLGACGFVAKPFSAEKILRALHRAIGEDNLIRPAQQALEAVC